MLNPEPFVRYGQHRGFVLKREGGMYGEIEIYDVGEDDCVGAKYSDGSCQIQPAGWHERFGLRKALAKLREARESGRQPRPRLKDSKPQRPSLKDARPRLKDAEPEAKPPKRPRLRS